MDGGPLQPALRLRPLRPQFRAAQSAQFLVQQSARLVPDLRGPRRAEGRQPGHADPRRDARCATAPWPPGRADDDNPFTRFAEALARHVGLLARHAVRAAGAGPAARGAARHGRSVDCADCRSSPKRQRGSGRPGNASGFDASSTRAFSPPSTRRRASASSIASGWTIWSARWPAPPATARGLRDDAAAVRSRDTTLGEIGDWPLGAVAERSSRACKLSKADAAGRRRIAARDRATGCSSSPMSVSIT